MGCAIDEVVVSGDSATVYAEGEFITYILVSGKPKYTAFSKNYSSLFGFRCQTEHESAAMEALSKITTEQEKSGAKKRKRRKKKVKVSKYAIDIANLVSWKLRDKQYWNFDQFPVDESGEFIFCSFEDIIEVIQKKVRKKYRDARNKKEKPDHQQFITSALDEIGCFDYWSRGRIHSYLSKLGALNRKEKKRVAKNRVLKEAREVEHTYHQFPIPIDII